MVDLQSVYNAKYAKGEGWTYRREQELRVLRERVLSPIRLTPPATVIDIGCGEGFHAELLAHLGFDVVGIDQSDVAIAHARALRNGPLWYCGDAAEYLQQVDPSVDLAFSRGCSWWHYELAGINANSVDVEAMTGLVFMALRPGGHFVLQIKTDFSGDRDRGVHHNTLADYRSLMGKFGTVVFNTDWSGLDLGETVAPPHTAGGIIIGTRKE